MEQQLADRARRAKLANCNCKGVGFTIVGSPEVFEAEMNLPCPAHGLRRLGTIMQVVPANMDGTSVSDRRLDELLATYAARLAQADREQANDAQES